jgi:hypothetical protein
MTMAPMRTKHHVIRPQMRADTNRDGFFTDVSMASAMNQAALVGPDQLFFALADDLHLAIEAEEESEIYFGCEHECL